MIKINRELNKLDKVNELYNSRFFTYKDDKIEHLLFDLEPNFWWSRLYEYKWCMDILDDIIDIKSIIGIKGNNINVLDSSCGTYHPFKFAIADKCNTYACDLDVNILNKQELINQQNSMFGVSNVNTYDKIKFNVCDIAKMPYENNFFDVIFNISVLEHLDSETQKNVFKEFNRCLNDNGMIVITADYPSTEPEIMIEYANDNGLELISNSDFRIKNDCIYSEYFGSGLNCYRMIFKKIK